MEIGKRTKEIVNIFKKLKELNLGIECFEEFDELRSICNDFIRTGNIRKGEIEVPGTKRIICYDFNDNEVTCYLKYDNKI